MILEIGAILNGQIPRDFRHEIPARSIGWAQDKFNRKFIDL